MPAPDQDFLISRRLRNLRAEIMSCDPMEFAPQDDSAIGVELNAWRPLLARLASVHQQPHRLEGWGSLEVPRLIRGSDRRAPATRGKRGSAENSSEGEDST